MNQQVIIPHLVRRKRRSGYAEVIARPRLNLGNLKREGAIAVNEDSAADWNLVRIINRDPRDDAIGLHLPERYREHVRNPWLEHRGLDTVEIDGRWAVQAVNGLVVPVGAELGSRRQ